MKIKTPTSNLKLPDKGHPLKQQIEQQVMFVMLRSIICSLEPTLYNTFSRLNNQFKKKLAIVITANASLLSTGFRKYKVVYMGLG